MFRCLQVRCSCSDVCVYDSVPPVFLTKRSLGEVQAGQVVRFGAGLLVAQHQLSSVPAAETLVLRLLLPLRFPLLVLSLHPLPFGLGRLAV